MAGFTRALTAVYLNRIRGCHRFRKLIGTRSQSTIPSEIYNSRKKINLGCSNRPLPTYLNVDVLEEFKPDIVCNVEKLHFASDNEFDLVRASHIIEHFELKDCRNVIAEWRRVLRLGGYLIVCVPDFEALSWRTVLMPSGFALDAKTYSNGWINGLFALDLPPTYRHKIVFTYQSLKLLLEECGFRVTARLNYLNEEPYTLGIDDDSCNLYSLNLAARKE